jgi:glyoxylase-like metal-dependent hydrolase (beta-lactamase superfamily II)/8-oxo-dGTP pyrophosphatase MutT (NUDIX family)
MSDSRPRGRYTIEPGTRPAATLLLIRDAAPGPGWELLMMRRAERPDDFRSGAVVFPGGSLDVADAEAARFVLGPDDAGLSARYGLAGGMLDYAVAALRETFEEVGVLLACDDLGRAAEPQPAWRDWRGRLQRGEATLAQMCAALDLRLDLRGLQCWSHWVTPPGVPKRFDTRFFVAPMPPAQQAEPDRAEALDLMWLSPRQALDPARELKLLPVTQRTLSDLSVFANRAEALAGAAAQGVIPATRPRRARDRGGLTVVQPDHLAYAEVCKLDPDGLRHDAWCDLLPGRAVRLSPRVVRVTAPNPGPMTGPGTNSYFVGDAVEAAWALIDPGPADAGHLAALQAAAPGPVRWVLTTHTHVDHSPGAAAAAAAFGGAQVLGRRPSYPQGQDESFDPAREPQHGERLALGSGSTLRAIHTPGHASNHLCWLLEEEKLLFTGDHVMHGSTVVINPPDGDMTAYLRTLAALFDEDLQWLAPGHGFLVAEPHAVLRALIAHRLKREAKVVEALRPRGTATLDELLPEVYADTPPRLHPVARRSLLAHVLKLRDDGRVAPAGERGERWRWVGG